MSKLNCKKCNQNFETFNKDLGVESLVCPHCGHTNSPEPADAASAGFAEQSAYPVAEPVVVGGARQSCEWESQWKTNPVGAYVSTLKSILTSPVEYFAKIKPVKDYLSLAIFIYINTFISMIFAMGLQLLIGAAFDPTALMGLPMIVCMAIFGPVVAVGLTFLVGALFHLCFNFVGGSEKDFDVTMTVYGLSSAANLFGIIPFLGGLVQMVYFLIINIAGQAEAHEISGGRAFLSLMLPVLVIFCCAFTVIFAGAMMAGGLGVFLDSLGQY